MYLLCSHQFAEVSHQVNFKISTLIQQDLYQVTCIMNNELVPWGFSSGLGSLGSGNIYLGISSEMVCYHQNIFLQTFPRFKMQVIEVD